VSDTTPACIEFTGHAQSVSVATDAQILQLPLNTELFPGVPSFVRVHSGFRNEHALTAAKILAEVKNLLKAKDARQVAVVSSRG
jgi:hypothetical protein